MKKKFSRLRAQVILSQQDPFTKNTQYLILRKTHGGYWGFPGGGIEEGEEPKEAILRELQEETQLDVKNIKLGNHAKDVYASYNYGDTPIRKLVLYSATYKTPLIPVNISVIDDVKYPHPEHFEFRWVTYKSDISKLTFGSDDLKTLLHGKLK